MSRWFAILVVGVVGCGGDSSDPGDPFPDASGTYEVNGGFDGIPSSVASFEGTLDLSQASQESGDLEGSASIVAEINGEVLTASDGDLSPASVSSNGTVTFTMADPSGSWTFTGTLSESSITEGRHTLTAPGSGTFSGDWSATRLAGIRASVHGAQRPMADLMAALKRFSGP
jgi:hypothetical protein